MRSFLWHCALVLLIATVSACSDSPSASEADLSSGTDAAEAAVESVSADDTTVVGMAIPDSKPVTIESLTPGDRSCYLDVRSETGKVSTEMADFGMCERDDLIGRQVILTRSLSMILAESCDGNPECTDTEQVMLVLGADPVVPGAAPRPAVADTLG